MLEINETSAKANFLWQMDTISKYNRCAASKDTLLEIYETLRNTK
nr:MAG TPA: hypothetical protein [Caudoviricetes sp.]